MTTAPPEIREGRLERPDGRVVAWSETGVPDGRPLLRFPGTPGSRLAIRHDQSPWLERVLRVITTERPGFGASTSYREHRFPDTADDVSAVLDALGLDRVPVIGGSGGAPHLLSFATRHPDRVQAATVVVGITPLTGDEGTQMIGINAEGFRLATAGDREGMTQLLTPVRDAVLADPLGAFRAQMETAPPADQAIMRDAGWQEGLKLGITEALRAGVDGWVDEAMLMVHGWSDIDPADVRASLTWWHGDHDRNAPLSAVQRWLREIPQAKLIVWPDAGHLTPYHHEGEILDELLGRVEAG